MFPFVNPHRSQVWGCSQVAAIHLGDTITQFLYNAASTIIINNTAVQAHSNIVSFLPLFGYSITLKLFSSLIVILLLLIHNVYYFCPFIKFIININQIVVLCIQK